MYKVETQISTALCMCCYTSCTTSLHS